ncbi:MAG: dihydroorotase [Deltaproteobacteria bacterium]|nr:dihydroorotase [Deltaproteobacteria bacterium]
MAGRIASIKPPSKDPAEFKEGWEVIEADGLLVIPGLIDLHTHLREPGFEYKETIRTGTRAASEGGFTSVLCMANTDPVNDTEAVTRYILKKAGDEGSARVYCVGALSAGLNGGRLAEFSELKGAGCVAVSDDGRPVANSSLMRRALEYADFFDMPVITHAEEMALVGSGVMNEGVVSTRLGLKGIPNAAEDVMVARDIELARLAGARLHIAHVSTRGAVDLIRKAKKQGVKVTAEATPHHLTLNHEAVIGYNVNAKMNPPLRAPEDVEALRQGLKDGTIDCIATDHAPHSVFEKDVEFDLSANGVVGLETALGVCLKLVDEGVVDLKKLVMLMSANPAMIMGLDGGSLRIGAPADMAVIDLEREWVVRPSAFRSKGQNTAFAGWPLKGRVVKTIFNGELVHDIEKD